MPQRKFAYLLLISILCLFSSCFQIIEEVNLNKNGTGTVNLTVNLSASKTKVASIMLMDSINGYKVPSAKRIHQEMNEVVTYLKNSPGISNVSKTVDLENYIVSVSFAFSNLSNINHLSDNILKRLKVKTMGNSSYAFNPAKQSFQRSYLYNRQALSEYNKLKPEVRNVFKEASYTSIYRFQNPVIGVTNPLAKVSKTKKAVMLNVGILPLIYGKTNISNIVTLAK